MKESNSDWLDETVSGNVNNSNNDINSDINKTNNINNINSTNNSENMSNNLNQTNEIQSKEEKRDLSTQTFSGMVDKVEEEELSEEEKCLNEFIGPNAEKFSYKIISFPGLIFSSLYILYRKMYLLGIISFAAQLAILLFINPYLSLIVNALICIFFNSIYISHAKRKIEKITHSSASKESGYVMNVCAEKGGINKGIVILFFILECAIIVLSILFLPVNKYLSDFKATAIDYTDEMGIDLEFE